MNTFEFDGKKYKVASKHQQEWGFDFRIIIQVK